MRHAPPLHLVPCHQYYRGRFTICVESPSLPESYSTSLEDSLDEVLFMAKAQFRSVGFRKVADDRVEAGQRGKQAYKKAYIRESVHSAGVRALAAR